MAVDLPSCRATRIAAVLLSIALFCVLMSGCNTIRQSFPNAPGLNAPDTNTPTLESREVTIQDVPQLTLSIAQASEIIAESDEAKYVNPELESVESDLKRMTDESIAVPVMDRFNQLQDDYNKLQVAYQAVQERNIG